MLDSKPSVCGNSWYLKPPNEQLSLAIVQKFGISDAMARFLSLKNFISLDNIQDFLNPSIRVLMPDPSLLLDMDVAVDHVFEAIVNKKKIAIFGDYDVDGACSSALIKRFLVSIGVHDVKIYIPDRVSEGYGPNSNALLGLRKGGIDLVITVDCGTVAFEPLEVAANAGLDIIVIDHHVGVKSKPRSIAVINPNRADEISDLTYLCGAGVSFMFVTALNRKLKNNGFYESNNIVLPNLIKFTDLVALATICDVVPLVGLNRAFVRTGLEVLNQKNNLGITSLIHATQIANKVTEYHLGFVIGPCINAGGRIGKSDLGATLLSSNDQELTSSIAAQLVELNVQRKDIESAATQHAMDYIENNGLLNKEMLFAGHESYHQGIIGIIAGRLKEKYGKPTCVMEFKNGVAKASLRSIPNVDIGKVVNLAVQKGLLIAGGGHASAAGFSCLLDKLSDLKLFFDEMLARDIAIALSNKSLEIDAFLPFKGISDDLLDEIEKLSPFGQGFSRPVFYVDKVTLLKTQILKEKHLAVVLKCDSSAKSMRSVVFNFQNSFVGRTLSQIGRDSFSVAFTVQANYWLGNKTPEITIVDIML